MINLRPSHLWYIFFCAMGLLSSSDNHHFSYRLRLCLRPKTTRAHTCFARASNIAADGHNRHTSCIQINVANVAFRSVIETL